MSNRKIKSHRNIYITNSNGFIYAITILYYALENLLRGYVVFFHRINNQSNKNHKICSGKINKICARPTHRKLQTLL